jgi:hypothetical protein
MEQKLEDTQVNTLAREWLERAIECLSESRAIENIANIDYKNNKNRLLQQGYFGAFVEAWKKGKDQIKLSKEDLFLWYCWICQEFSESLEDMPDILSNLVDEFLYRLETVGRSTNIVDIVILMGDFYQKLMLIHPFSNHNFLLSILILNYIAAWFKFPIIIIREKNDQKFFTSYHNKQFIYYFLAKKIQEVVFNLENRLLTFSEDYDWSAVYRSPSVTGCTIVEWHTLRTRMSKWKDELFASGYEGHL